MVHRSPGFHAIFVMLAAVAIILVTSLSDNHNVKGDANQGDGKDLVYGQTEHQNASESEAGESPVRLQTEPQYEMEDINEANMVMNSECIVGGERFIATTGVNYCAYAIGVCGDSFLDELIYNDRAFKSIKCEDITIADLEKSSRQPCGNTNLHGSAYGGGVVRVKKCERCREITKLQVFFMCCHQDSCDTKLLGSVKKTKNMLKLYYLAQSSFSLGRSVRSKITQDGHHFREFGTMNYIITNKLRAKQSRLMCLQGNGGPISLRETPLHKSVCVTYVGVKSSAYKLSELTTMRSLDAIRRDFGSWVFGQMDIAESIPTFPGELINCNKEYGEHATNNEIVDSCKAFYGQGEAIFLCCCYGSAPFTCQMRLQNGVLPNYSTDGKLRCLHRSDSKYGREKHIFADVVKHMQQTMGHANPFEVSREAQKIHIGIGIETDTVCESVIYRKMDKLYFVRQDRSSAADEVRNMPTCDRLYHGDYRLDAYFVKPCFVTLPYSAMCPFDEGESRNDDFEAFMCCCTYAGLCNLDLFMWNRLLYKPDKNCRYNNDYQHLTNKFLMVDSAKNHSCLVHYANGEVMTGLYNGTEKTGQLVNANPGAALMPVDRSYATLSNNECDYIETKVNEQYVKTRKCARTELSLETNYLPLKLFVCRCSTDPNSTLVSVHTAEPCDVKIAKSISQIEEDAAKQNIKVRHRTYCAVYTSLSPRVFAAGIVNKENQKFNRESSVCYTKVVFDTEIRRPIRYEAGIATRKIVNDHKMPLDHIAYLTLTSIEGTTAEDRCVGTVGEVGAICFCREYTRDKTLGCNSDYEAVIYAIREVVNSFSKQDMHADLVRHHRDMSVDAIEIPGHDERYKDYRVFVFIDTSLTYLEEPVHLNPQNSSITKAERAICVTQLADERDEDTACVSFNGRAVCCCEKCDNIRDIAGRMILW